jgi:sugar/nucleoside kinase (ribokinase family)
VSYPRVLCVGILVADIFVPPLKRLPRAGELLASPDFLIQSGGCAANVAVDLSRLGVEAAVCGRVGDDLFGTYVEQALAARGIDARGVLLTRGIGTSKTIILPVTGEDRRFVHSFGANAALTAADIDDELLEHAEVLYLGGYLILPGLREQELVPRLEAARARGTLVVLDVAAPSGRGASMDAVTTLLPHADYFVPNVDEARALTRLDDPREQAERFVGHGANRVMIKLGDRGVFVHDGTRAFELAAPSVSVVEPSGAGDAFAAGLIVALLEEWELEPAARYASVIGASACRALGCSDGVFTRAEADVFLAEHSGATR